MASAPEHLASVGLRYGQRIALACALGFDATFKDALVALGTIRNAFSHKLDTKLTDEVVNGLFSKLPAFGKEAVRVSHEHMKSLSKTADRVPFEDLSARDRFVLIALNLERLVMAAVLMVEAAQAQPNDRSGG